MFREKFRIVSRNIIQFWFHFNFSTLPCSNEIDMFKTCQVLFKWWTWYLCTIHFDRFHRGGSKSEVVWGRFQFSQTMPVPFYHSIAPLSICYRHGIRRPKWTGIASDQSKSIEKPRGKHRQLGLPRNTTSGLLTPRWKTVKLDWTQYPVANHLRTRTVKIIQFIRTK